MGMRCRLPVSVFVWITFSFQGGAKRKTERQENYKGMDRFCQLQKELLDRTHLVVAATVFVPFHPQCQVVGIQTRLSLLHWSLILQHIPLTGYLQPPPSVHGASGLRNKCGCPIEMDDYSLVCMDITVTGHRTLKRK
jgi:hypothetical protein